MTTWHEHSFFDRLTQLRRTGKHVEPVPLKKLRALATVMKADSNPP